MKTLFTILIILMMAISVSGYNDRRDGFVTAAGFGMAPVSKFSYHSIDENEPALAFNGFIGAGFDNNNIIAIELNATFRHSSYYTNEGKRLNEKMWLDWGKHGSQLITQGLLGLSWYHYFDKPGQSLFTVVGTGIYTLKPSSVESPGSYPGFMLGGGYEFTPHYQIAGYVSFGRTENQGYNQVSILVTRVAY